ncbi:MAG: DNA polymerase III subunit beta [Anaerolineae bacterium]|nr:DNA polymerase III subunit beta [Thermoflexales bacterium]MDW8395089.1 DNA polymerase III subunit beta [Anaerolineae bacterium]
MKVSCLQENLARALNVVGRAVASRSTTYPILTHVLLATDNGRLKVAATNLETGITCWIGAKVEGEGAITVPARTFTDLIALLPPDKIDLEVNVRTQSLHIRSGRTDANLKGVDAQEFPIIPSFAPDAAMAFIEAGALKKLVSQVSFAASTDENRPSLTGVLTKIEDSRVTMVATDGFRLSLRSSTLKDQATLPENAPPLLIPARAVTEVARVLGDQEKPVAVSFTPSHNQVIFHGENIDVVAQLIEHKFPQYESIIPRKYDTRTVVNTAEFLKACRQASIFARESADAVRLTIKPGEDPLPGQLLVAARADQTGENLIQLEALISGNALEIGFNVRYLIEVLSVIDAPQVALETTGATSPAVIRAVGDDQFLHLIMPMNLAKTQPA